MFDFIKTNWLLCAVIFLAVVAPSFLFGAMKFILIFILAGVAIIYLLSIILGLRVSRLQRDMNKNMGNNYQSSASGDDKQEGDVNIFYSDNMREKKVSNKVGEYVDFEEVKEDK